jgi:hypothetical protein
MAEATDNVAWPLLKNRVLTLDANTWPSRAGWIYERVASKAPRLYFAAE